MAGSKSQSTTTQKSTTVAGSTVTAGGNIFIEATGSGKDCTITVLGTDINAGDSANLKADGKINLQGVKSTTTTDRDSSCLSDGVGVTLPQKLI